MTSSAGRVTAVRTLSQGVAGDDGYALRLLMPHLDLRAPLDAATPRSDAAMACCGRYRRHHPLPPDPGAYVVSPVL